MSPRRTLCLAALLLAAPPLAARDTAKKDLLGDPLPAGAVARMGTARLRGDSTISAVAFAPDGKTLVSAGLDSKVTWWDVATGKATRSVRLPNTNHVTALQFSKDGKTLAAAGYGNESGVHLLDGATAEYVKFLRDPLGVGYQRHVMALSPDGKTVLTHDPGNLTLLVWDVAEAKVRHRVLKVGGQGGVSLAFTPDGKHFVSAWTDRKLHLVSVADGKSVRDLETDESLTAGTRLASNVTALALSSDGKQVVYRRYNDRAFAVLDVPTGKLARTWESAALSYHGYGTGKLALSRDGRFLFEASGGGVRVWGMASGKLLREFGSGSYLSGSFALSADGKRIALASNSVLSILDVATSKPIHGGIGHQSAPLHLAFTRDGKRLVSLGNTTLRVWDADSGKQQHQVRQFGQPASHVSADDSGVRWVGGDRSVYRWEFGEREAARTTSPRVPSPYSPVSAVSPDGRTLAVVTEQERKFRLISLLDNKPDRDLLNLSQNYSAIITFSPDSRFVALSTFSDGVVTLFEVVAGVELRKLQTLHRGRSPGAAHVAFAPDGRSLLKYDGQTRLIETGTGGERLRLANENAGVPKMAWSGDGRLVALGYGDGRVTVHDAFTGRELFRKDTGQGTIYSLALRGDGRRLATGGANTTVLVWEVPGAGRVTSELGEKEAWRELESTDSSQGYLAMKYFLANPDDAVKRFKDRIRARAGPDGKRIGRLIQDLDDDAYAVRERASEELADIGAPALEAIQAALKDPPSLEVKRRCETLLRKIRGGASVAPDRVRAVRAVEVLERIGSPAARDVLKHLLKQKMAPDVEAAIEGALRRLGEKG